MDGFAKSSKVVHDYVDGLHNFFTKVLEAKQVAFEYKYRLNQGNLLKRGERALTRDDIEPFLKRVTGVERVILSDGRKPLIVKIVVNKVFHRNGDFWFDEIKQDCLKILKVILPLDVPFEVEVVNKYITED